MPEGYSSIIPYGEAANPILEKYQGELLIPGESDRFIDFFEGQ